MTRNYLLLSVCAVAIATATPALALNPQPLPPGFKSQVKVNTGHTATAFCNGSHFRR